MGLYELLSERLIDYPVTERKMFGCPVFFLNDNMMAGIFEDSIFIRLPTDQIKTLMEEDDEISNFEPLKGRKMKEYIILSENLMYDSQNLAKTIKQSVEYVSKL